MEQTSFIYQDIICKEKIPQSDFTANSSIWGKNLVLLALSLFCFYYVNTHWDPTTENLIMGNVASIIFLFVGIYFPFQARRKLRITFYADKRSLDSKDRLIHKIERNNHWELLKSDKNYYLFFENNLITQSYYITIVFNEIGFYINCYPNKGRLFDFGRAQRWSDELYSDIKDCL